ncbi:hypothetical protein [Candidatus Protofrankia californiensis]|uniref:hypothetical protein n=1 Tax=Candidatus Protofrankia californiensis TaxID=1839754 RepID=UPI001041A48C|nr:hypothetical protein [Candidatus Protofrankia californiensis]
MPGYPSQPVLRDPRAGGFPGGGDPATGVTGGYGGGWDLSVEGTDHAAVSQRDTGPPDTGQGSTGQGAGHPWQPVLGPTSVREAGADDRQPGVLRGFGSRYPDVLSSADGHRNRPRDGGGRGALPAGGAFSGGGQPDRRRLDTGAARLDERQPGGPQSLPGRVPPAGVQPGSGFAGSAGSSPARGLAEYGISGPGGNGASGSGGVLERYGSDRPVNGYGLAGRPAGYPASAGGDRGSPARQPDTVDPSAGPGNGSRPYSADGPIRAAQLRDRGRVPSAGLSPSLTDRGNPLEVGLDVGPATRVNGPTPVGHRSGGYPDSGASRPAVRGPGVDDDAPATPDAPRPTAGRADSGNDRAVLLPPAYRGSAASAVDPLVPVRMRSRTASRSSSAMPGAGMPAVGVPDGAAFADSAEPDPSFTGSAGQRIDPVLRTTDALRSRTPRGNEPSSPVVPSAALGQSLSEMTTALSRIGSAPDAGPHDTGPHDTGPYDTGPYDTDPDDDDGWKPSSTVRKKAGRAGTTTPRVSSSRAASANTMAREPEQRSRASAAVKRAGGRMVGRRGGPDLDSDLGDDIDRDDRDDGGPGFLASHRRGWVGPLVVATLVSLVAIGLYVLLSGGEDAPPAAQEKPVTPISPAVGSATPATSNPDAATGLALVDGTYRCYRADGADLRLLAALPNKFVVARESGSYLWDDQQGTYSITKNSLSTDTVIFTDLQFTGGPLKDVKALFIDRVRDGDAGKDAGFLTFKDGSNRWCAIN